MYPIKESSVLPEDFDGVFKFTNASDRPFAAKWNGVEYAFPAMSTSRMIIAGATPEEVQHIRKKFAKEYAEREFYRSGKFKTMEDETPAGSGKSPAIYSGADLEPYINQCLEPLPVARASAKILPKEDNKNYHTEVTTVLDSKDLDNKKPLVAGSAPIL